MDNNILSSENIGDFERNCNPSKPGNYNLHIDANNAGITKVYNDTFDEYFQLRTLDLSDNYIQGLPYNVFHKLENLQCIELQNNRISKIDVRMFHYLNNLTKLNLQNNYLKEINQNLFDDIPNLNSLNLSENQLSVLPNWVFSKLPMLSYLNLSSNNLEFLPWELFQSNVRLTALFLDDNENLNQMPDKIFQGLKILRKLGLRNVNMKNIKVSWFEDLHSLRQIDFGGNNLSSIPPATFKLLPNLKSFDISHNQLEIFYCWWLKPCTNLRNLHLNDNNLLEMSFKSFTFFKNLETISLHNNYFNQHYLQEMLECLIDLGISVINYDNEAGISVENNQVYGITCVEDEIFFDEFLRRNPSSEGITAYYRNEIGSFGCVCEDEVKKLQEEVRINANKERNSRYDHFAEIENQSKSIRQMETKLKEQDLIIANLQHQIEEISKKLEANSNPVQDIQEHN